MGDMKVEIDLCEDERKDGYVRRLSEGMYNNSKVLEMTIKG